MRRFFALLSLLVATTMGAPAAAQVGHCLIAEQVYGITGDGDLIVQPFCASPGNQFQQPRTLASFGTQVPRLFYGGQLEDTTVVIYGVDDAGTLRWYRENSATGRLAPGVVIGSLFGDWRNYQHLQTTGKGDLSGLDGDGRLWRWRHTGWKTGADTWGASVPEDGGMGCEGARPVFAGRDGPERYVGVTEKAPSSYVYCGYDAQTRMASLLPEPELAEMTMAVGPGVTYALRPADSRLVRLELDTTSAVPRWHAQAVALWGYTAIFTGRSIVSGRPSPPTFKYEWQWTWYIENG